MILTFGKYRGSDINELYNSDRGYLIWVATKQQYTHKSCERQIQHIKELVAADVEAAKIAEQSLCEHRKAAYAPILTRLGSACMKQTLKRGTQMSFWIQSIFKSLETGEKFSPRAQEIITHLCGKGSGRRNSKAYNAVTEVIHQAFEQANNLTSNHENAVD